MSERSFLVLFLIDVKYRKVLVMNMLPASASLRDRKEKYILYRGYNW